MVSERQLYLTVCGQLLPDDTLVLTPCLQTELAHGAEDTNDSPLRLDQLSDDGSVLEVRAIAIAEICTFGVETGVRGVIAKVPFHSDARVLRFVLNDREIHRVNVPRAHPQVRLTWDPEPEVGGRRAISWEGSHEEGAPLHYVVFYSHGGESWQPLSLLLPGTSIDADFDSLPGGEGRIAVVATDGVNTTRTESQTFRVAIKPCLATILAPFDGTRVEAGRRVLLVGQGFYSEEQQPETEQLSWTSSLDGNIGSGSLVDAILSPGEHTITLTAGGDRRPGTASISVVVEPQDSALTSTQ